jgi:hypothetical protein
MRVAAAAVSVLVLALPAAAAPPPRATLELDSLAPLVVEGRDFGRLERVSLTAAAPSAQRMVGVVARRDGSFTARFGLRLARCATLTVRAVGVRGSRAILQVEPGCTTRRRGRGPG